MPPLNQLNNTGGDATSSSRNSTALTKFMAGNISLPTKNYNSTGSDPESHKKPILTGGHTVATPMSNSRNRALGMAYNSEKLTDAELIRAS